MSEFIIEWSDIGGQLANLLNGNVPLVLWPKKIREECLREKIVRCRDCKYYHEAGVASYTPFCEWMNDSDVTPDGFCAWAERW